jgi:Cu+-exporting ATPase
VVKEMGEIVYAGGKQTGGSIEILVIKEVAQSYLTRLWNQTDDKKQRDEEKSFVHLLSRYFTWGVFSIAALAAVYWGGHNSATMWNAVTAVLIVACPCALLLSNTFTNGNILRTLGRSHCYLRNAQVIEDIANTDCIVFDKTGTLTTGSNQEVVFEGAVLTQEQREVIGALAAQSSHPLSKAIAEWAGSKHAPVVMGFREIPGKGIEGIVAGDLVTLGSAAFVTGNADAFADTAMVYVSVEEKIIGRFKFKNHYRESIPALLRALGKQYPIAILSGDNAGERHYLRELLGPRAILLFNQQPQDKLEAIRKLQQAGHKVMMVGDGLNDAGALRQADTGIAVSEHSNNFTPASDVILAASQLPLLTKFIRLCKANKRIVLAAFIVSILYNIVGLFFAVQGLLSPMIAAILMPLSSLSILLITYGASQLTAARLGVR